MQVVHSIVGQSYCVVLEGFNSVPAVDAAFLWHVASVSALQQPKFHLLQRTCSCIM
jgi:uncharacterized membrane protein